MRYLHLSIFLISTLLILLMVSFSPALAQEQGSDEDQSERPRVTGYFSVGGIIMNDNDALNNQLGTHGYPTFNDRMLSFGGGGYRLVADRFMIGVEAFAQIAGRGTYQDREITLGSGYGFLNVGYLFEPASGVRAYPLLGVGVGTLTIGVGSEPIDDFEDAIESPDREVSLNQESGLINVGTGVEFSLGEKGGFTGLRAGYTFSFYKPDWRSTGGTLSESPDASLQGPYLHLLIGWSLW